MSPCASGRARLLRIGHLACLISAALLVSAFPARASAQEEQAAEAPPSGTTPTSTELTLARALESRMTVWRRPDGRVVYVSHCRAVRGGCRARIAAFARWIAEVSGERSIDPFVLAAMAVRESGLDPFARGPAGELGIIQLHPRGIGRGVRFITSETYRTRCARQPGACQREVLAVGASHLDTAITTCGSLEAGLGAYNSGACGETAYTRRILRERARLIELAKTDARPPAMRNVD
jgi:hypothetical protein